MVAVSAVPAVVSPSEAAKLIERGAALGVDCRSDIADRARGALEYAQSHLPGAVYADLERDLSDMSLRGRGRHPLPSDSHFSAVLSRWGIDASTHVIAYDAASGAMAARLWWMLRAAGHARASVLDGGFAAWVAAGLPLEQATAQRMPSRYEVAIARDAWLSPQQVQDMLDAGAGMLVDARAAPRFRGENETIDPVAGHVPGAVNRPFADNLVDGARFKPVAQLRSELDALLAGRAAKDVVHMCGSGVTACHNVLAMEHAGLPGARVFADSWSGWISDPERPVATGA